MISGGKAVFRKVETGITGATDIEVLSGLKEGDEIITGTYQVIRTLRNETQRRRWITNTDTSTEGLNKHRNDLRRNRKSIMATAVAENELRERGEQLKRDGIVIQHL